MFISNIDQAEIYMTELRVGIVRVKMDQELMVAVHT